MIGRKFHIHAVSILLATILHFCLSVSIALQNILMNEGIKKKETETIFRFKIGCKQEKAYGDS